jgi:hypothetical protein
MIFVHAYSPYTFQPRYSSNKGKQKPLATLEMQHFQGVQTGANVDMGSTKIVEIQRLLKPERSQCLQIYMVAEMAETCC